VPFQPFLPEDARQCFGFVFKNFSKLEDFVIPAEAGI
jgi:hypothetical protein